GGGALPGTRHVRAAHRPLRRDRRHRRRRAARGGDGAAGLRVRGYAALERPWRSAYITSPTRSRTPSFWCETGVRERVTERTLGVQLPARLRRAPARGGPGARVRWDPGPGRSGQRRVPGRHRDRLRLAPPRRRLPVLEPEGHAHLRLRLVVRGVGAGGP